MDLTSLRRAAAKAMPLTGRGCAGDPGGGGDERADRRLRRWQEQAPFASADWFARRLAADGLNAERLRALLAESADSLAERVTAEPWIDWLASSFESRAPAPEIPKDSAFAVLFGPLLGAAKERLLGELADVSTAPCLGRLSHVVDRLLQSLIADSHRMAERTMILELNVAGLRGQLAGDTPRDRYHAFTRLLSDPGRAIELLTEYPVLARQVTITAAQWVRTSSSLLRRLVHDQQALAETFGGGRPLGSLDDVRSGLGDRHRGGACVAQLAFTNGVLVMYKPRSVSVDAHFQRLIEWLNPGLRHPLRTFTCLLRDGYGWVEHVASEPCRTPGELQGLYRRSGSLLALLYLLDAIDCHAHNVIVAGDQPIVVDLETLLQPLVAQPGKPLSVADQLAHIGAVSSVLRPGMLPHRAWASDGGSGVDVSALGWRPGQIDPLDGPVAVEAGTDRMRVEYRPVPLGELDRGPPALGRPSGLLEFLDDFDAGFCEAYEHFTGRRQELSALVMAFADHEIRLLRRDTRDYATLLRSSFHPDLLRDGLDRDRHFDRLWALAAHDESVLPFLPHERRDLWNNDIPLFITRPSAADLVGTDGTSLGNLVERPAIEAVLAKIERLGADDLDRQRWIYRSAISISCVDADVLTPAYQLRLADPVPDAHRLREDAERAAARVAERLRQLAYRGPADTAWIGPNMTAQTWGVAPLGPDLYTGTSGIALFLEHLATRTGDADHRAAADAAESTLRMQLDRRAGLLTGGFESAGGILLALAHLHRLRPAGSWDVLAHKVLDRVEVIAHDDVAHDLLGGNAGTIGGMVAWHAVHPDDRIRRLVRGCADHLIRAAAPQGRGIGWIPVSLAKVVDRPIAGFAHGGSGIAWALTLATTLLDEPRYAAAAVAALEYERGLFDPATASWLDIRTPPRSPVLWCHGAAGIGMSRLAMSGVLDDPLIDEELSIAVDTVVRAGFGHNFSLCHGDLGNLDLLLQTASLSSTGASIALRHARAVLDGIEAHGWVCGLPGGMEAPSLMVGLAGIGYGLLRIAAPAAVPSVLVMQPPA